MTTQFLEKLKKNPTLIEFTDVIEIIDNNYKFTPTSFQNGTLFNEKNQNNGSCKIFAFAKENNLSKDETLHCFGKFYRTDVLENPKGTDHQNIRNFIKTGWNGIQFKTNPLIK